jgi:hypothetical protein
MYVMVKWVSLLLRIRKASGSNLCLEAGYPNRIFVVFLSTQANAYIVLKLGHNIVLLHPFQFVIH